MDEKERAALAEPEIYRLDRLEVELERITLTNGYTVAQVFNSLAERRKVIELRSLLKRLITPQVENHDAH